MYSVLLGRNASAFLSVGWMLILLLGRHVFLQQTLLSGRDADPPVGEACFLRQTLLSGRGLQV